jgi:hypothetical protein
VRAFHLSVIETLLSLEGTGHGDEPATFVLGQVEALPVLTRTGVQLAALFLAGLTVLTRGAWFPRLSLDRRQATVRRWDSLGLPPARLYLRLMRSLTLFAAFDPAA